MRFLSALLCVLNTGLIFSVGLSMNDIFTFVACDTCIAKPVSTVLGVKCLLSKVVPSAGECCTFVRLRRRASGKGGASLYPGSLELRGISFTCRESGYVLGGVSVLFTGSDGATVVKHGNSKGAAVVGLLAEVCRPADNRVLLKTRGVSRLPLPRCQGVMSIIDRRVCLFGSAVEGGVYLCGRVSSAIVRTTYGSDKLRSFVGRISLSRIMKRGKTVLSNKRGRGVTLTETLIRSGPVVVFSRTASGASTCSRRRVGKLLSAQLGSGAIVIVARGGRVLDGISRVIMLGRKIITSLKECSSLVKGDSRLGIVLRGTRWVWRGLFEMTDLFYF